ncbi:hypothetical protein CBR_g5590 [Chara braunii]|uniref:DUF659 domain-containing protein n=1 Tax=Chara braunii TaxID=69332 RepID=A0A388JRI1_CHABU|nr:hypothetical protein CBR_g5590 [Chara braunii]|eukprot:GBG60414.1 hypothetical protein CBR_g5590 [Chara braunii]
MHTIDTDQTNKPIMNFIAAGQSGPVLIRTIDMSEREKTHISLAQIWESVIHDDIGVDRVNAICTDNAEVMKTTASVLQSHPDPQIARIPWIPCAAHCLSLLQRDIAVQPWAQLMKRAHKIVKFMRNKQKAQTLHRKAGGSLNLKRPADMRFRIAYMMLERLWDQREVLDSVVSSDAWKRLRWAGDARVNEPEVRRLCRSDWWWKELKRVMDVMEPCYTFLRAMDLDRSSPSGLWDLESILTRMIDTLQLPAGEKADVMEIVADRRAMIRQPTHAAAYLLDPRRRDLSLLMDRSASVVQSALHHFARHLGARWNAEEMHGRRIIDLWSDMVEDPPEEVDDADVIPPDEQEWEVMDRANRRKDGRGRVTSGGGVNDDGLGMEVWQDVVWMHREMMEQSQGERNKGKALAEEQHDLLDEWAELDPHRNFNGNMDGSLQTVRDLRARVGGHVDMEGLLARDAAEDKEEHRHEDVITSSRGMET